MPHQASLPMYDWPEVHWANDELWSQIASRLQSMGIDGPVRLSRPKLAECNIPEDALVWQECGWTFQRTGVSGRVALGSFGFDVPGCEDGDYHSLVVVRRDSRITQFEQLRGARVGYNSMVSQSGYWSLVSHIALHAGGGRFFSEALETGTHRESMMAVARGAVDTAAIDAVSWRLALLHEPASDELVVLGATSSVQGVVTVSAMANVELVDSLRSAIEYGLESCSVEARQALGIVGFFTHDGAIYQQQRRAVDRLLAATGSAMSTAEDGCV